MACTYHDLRLVGVCRASELARSSRPHARCLLPRRREGRLSVSSEGRCTQRLGSHHNAGVNVVLGQTMTPLCSEWGSGKDRLRDSGRAESMAGVREGSILLGTG